MKRSKNDAEQYYAKNNRKKMTAKTKNVLFPK